MQLQRGQFPYTDLSEVPDWYLRGLLGGTVDVKWGEMTSEEKQAVQEEVKRRQEVKVVKEAIADGLILVDEPVVREKLKDMGIELEPEQPVQPVSKPKSSKSPKPKPSSEPQ